MSYDREISTMAERRASALYAEALWLDMVRSVAMAPESGMFTGEHKDFWMTMTGDILYRLATNLHFHQSKVEGVATRRGEHNRQVKLRQGIRTDKYGENVTRWYVLDSAPGWLASIANNPEPQISVAMQVEREFGDYPEEHHIYADYSPTGEWFSNVRYRQVGRRVLVQWDHSLDC